jgi:hypothetical protein
MSLRKFTNLLALGLLAASTQAVAQQSNGRSYVPRTQIFGSQAQGGNDSGVNGYMLTTPIKTGNGPYRSWGTFYNIEGAADTAGTDKHGMALYGPTGTLMCSTYTARTVAVGVNAYSLSGCGVPQPNSSYTLAVLTNWSGDRPGDNAGAYQTTQECPGTTSFSGYASASSFPSTLPSTSAQSFCYDEWAIAVLAGGANGKFYGGNAALTATGGLPTGPWNSSGSWYGGLNSVGTFVSFSGGLSSGVMPTTSALANSTYGSPCTWSFGNATNSVLSGSAGGYFRPITPVAIGTTGYSGTGNLALAYTTGPTRNYVGCALGSSSNVFSVGFHLQTDLPGNDTANDWYDSGAINSADGTDAFGIFIFAGGDTLTLYSELIKNTATSYGTGGVMLQPNTNYWIEIQKTTNGATETIYVFDQDTGGSYVGKITGTAYAGAHPANDWISVIHGSEPNSTGSHIWEDDVEMSPLGQFLAP